MSGNRGNREALPKWARDELARLERDLEWWQAKATAGPDDSDTFVQELTLDMGTAEGHDGRPLGRRPTIRFGPRADRLAVEATRRDDGSVEVRVPDGQLAFYPVGSNIGRVVGIPWRSS